MTKRKSRRPARGKRTVKAHKVTPSAKRPARLPGRRGGKTVKRKHKIIEGLEQALAFAKGDTTGVRITRVFVPANPKPKRRTRG